MKTRRAAREISGIAPGSVAITVIDQVTVSAGLDPWLSLRALASYSGLSVRKLRYLLADPRHPLPFYRVGGKILVRRGDFDRWMVAHKVTPPLDTMIDEIIQALHRPVPRRISSSRADDIGGG